MSIFDRLFRPKNELPKPGDDSGWRMIFGPNIGKGYAGSPELALRVAAVFRCVDLVSKTMAALPLHLYERTKEGSQKATEHPLYNKLYVLPNEWTTHYELIQMLVANVMLTRGGFLKIKRDGRGRIISLWNIPTGNVSGPFDGKNSRYITVSGEKEGEAENLDDGEYLFVQGFRFSNDIMPNDPLAIAADVLGLSGSMQTFAENGFNGVNPGGFIEHPGSMSDKAYCRFKESFRENYEGVQNAGRWLFLEEGMKAQPWSKNMETSQLLESRKWAISEICRIFGVPPHLCMDMEHATFSNIEQQSMEFVRDCINPMCVKMEEVFYRDLLSTKERDKLYFKFNLNGLMRGDMAARTAYYHNARQDGWMSANDIRELEEMNRIAPEMGGDVYAVNGNMIPLAAVPFNLPKGVQTK